MRSVWLIARRELAATFRSPLGFVVAALFLAAQGLLFNLLALGGGEKFSTDVLKAFFIDERGTGREGSGGLGILDDLQDRPVLETQGIHEFALGVDGPPVRQALQLE